MRHFHIITYGCQMNDHESAALKGLLVDAGHVEAVDEESADLVIFNTCAVRAKAEQKVFSELGRYRLHKKLRPELIIGVGGCMAQSEGRKVFSRAPQVDFVFGTKTAHLVPGMVERVQVDRKHLVSTSMADEPEAMEDFYSHARGDGLKSFITVMQGCDNFCSYCIVPHVRGREVSRPSKDIVAEVQRLVESGVREVTLLGQNVNSYGLKGGDGADFPTLVGKVAKVDGLHRIRFTTSHPKDMSDALIELFATEPKLMAHVHLPLQSGSDRILEAMNRKYTVAHYLSLVEKLRAARPSIAITSDMIVGFPGEEEEDFAATLRVMELVHFDNLFSFKYSPRSKTSAAKLTDQLSDEVKEARLDRLQRLQKIHSLARNRELIGQKREVLVEGDSKAGGGQLSGRTPENKVINFEGVEDLVGQVVEVEILEAYMNSLLGRLLEDHPCS